MTDTRISVIAFGPDGLQEETVPLDGLDRLSGLAEAASMIWLNVDGPLPRDSVFQIGTVFKLHPLALEDVLHVRQRAKFEDYDKHNFLALPMPLVQLERRSAEDELQSTLTEQLSLFFGSNFVVTFQEFPGGDCLAPVREKLRHDGRHSRNQKADHLVYLIVDAVIDAYFPLLEALGERLEGVEEDILHRHDQKAPGRIYVLKRNVIKLRRCIWPLREAIHTLLRDVQPELVRDETKVYLRDCYDHAIRLLDLVEMDRELCSDLMDLHLSSSSNRMNEVMKVLAIITTLFIPPTFIAGIYGMNFNPDKSPWNMPELNWLYGYPVALLVMTSLMGGLLFWMHWKGWLKGISSAGSERSIKRSLKRKIGNLK